MTVSMEARTSISKTPTCPTTLHQCTLSHGVQLTLMYSNPTRIKSSSQTTLWRISSLPGHLRHLCQSTQFPQGGKPRNKHMGGQRRRLTHGGKLCYKQR